MKKFYLKINSILIAIVVMVTSINPVYGLAAEAEKLNLVEEAVDVTSECDNSDEEDVIVSDDEDSDESSIENSDDSSIDEDVEENADEDSIDENVGEDTSEDANTFDEENNFENDEQRSNDYPDDILNEDGLRLLEAENHEDVSATANNGHPIIDNEIDEIWNDTECINLERYNGVTDSAASARILWDDEAIYFRVNISDDTPEYLSDDLENRDAVEIFIDEDLSDLNEEETIHFSIDRSNNLIVNGEIDEKEGISHCVSDNSDGYSVEISYKWKNAGYKLGKEIRADIKVNDSDEENIQGTINWSDENANSSLDSSLWGKVILEEQLKDEVVVTVEDALYVGKAVTPAVKVVRNGEELTCGVDYTLKYLNNIRTAKKPEDGYSASAPTVVITGKGDYTSIIRANFSILPADFSTQADSFYVSYANNIKSSVVALKPAVAIKYNGLIVNASQFVVKYRKYDSEALLDSIPAESYGDYYIVVSASPKGLFTGKNEFPLHIINRNQKYASSFTIGVIKSKVYTGNPIELSTEKNGKAAPEIWVKDGKTLLSPGIDYSISYEDNKRVGKAKVIITGKGNYLGSVTRYFNITGIPVSKFKIVLPHDHDYTDVGKWWTGSPITFTEDELIVTYLDEKVKRTAPDSDEDGYYLEYLNNVNAGDNNATVKIIGTGKYSGTVSRKFSVIGLKLWAAQMQEVQTLTYNGELQIPKIKYKYYLSADYKTVFFNNYFKTNKYHTYDTIDLNECFYEVIPDIGGINAGKASYVVEGREIFKRAKRVNIVIKPYDVVNSGKDVSVADIAPVIYSKAGNRPKAEVLFKGNKLTEGKDYTVSYQNNNKVTNEAYVVYTFKGNFSGTIKKKFVINASKIDDNFIVNANDIVVDKKKYNFKTSLFIYDGNGRKLTPNVDYEYKNAKFYIENISDENLIDLTNISKYKEKLIPGTKMYIVSKGINNYSGDIIAQYYISDMLASSVKIKVDNHLYTGRKVNFDSSKITAFVVVGNKRIDLEYGKDFVLTTTDSFISAGVHNVTFQPVSPTKSGGIFIGGTRNVKVKINSRKL